MPTPTAYLRFTMLSLVAALALTTSVQAQSDSSSAFSLPSLSGSPPLSDHILEEARWREVLEREPNNPEAYARLARALRLQSADAYREVIRLAPDNPDVWPYRPLDYLPFSEVADAYREAIRLNPGRTESYIVLGRMLTTRHYYKEAVEVYQQAMQVDDILDPFNLDSMYSGLGFALLDLERNQEAEVAFRTAIERTPYTSTTHLGSLAIALRRQEKMDEAEAVYRQIIQTLVDEQQSRTSSASTVEQESISVSVPPDVVRYPNASGDSLLAHAYTDLGDFLTDQGRLNEAEEAYKQALSASFPDDDDRVSLSKARAYNSLGDLYRLQGRAEEATRVFETIQTWFPEYFERYGLSVVETAD